MSGMIGLTDIMEQAKGRNGSKGELKKHTALILFFVFLQETRKVQGDLLEW